MAPRVRLAVPLVPSVEVELRRQFDVTDWLEGADGAVTMPNDRVDAEFYERAGPRLGWRFITGRGGSKSGRPAW